MLPRSQGLLTNTSDQQLRTSSYHPQARIKPLITGFLLINLEPNQNSILADESYHMIIDSHYWILGFYQ